MRFLLLAAVWTAIVGVVLPTDGRGGFVFADDHVRKERLVNDGTKIGRGPKEDKGPDVGTGFLKDFQEPFPDEAEPHKLPYKETDFIDLHYPEAPGAVILASDPVKRDIVEAGDDLFETPFTSCCKPRLPKCCPFGSEMLWQAGEPYASATPVTAAQQPAVFNPKCLGSIDFDTIPSSGGQPFCHEITLVSVSPTKIKSAQLELIIYSLPPCSKKDLLCLKSGSEEEWCTILETGENHLCLDLDELGLLDSIMSTLLLLVRVAFHSSVDYLRLHTVMCEPVETAPPEDNASMHFEFTNSLSGVPPGPSSPFTYTSGAAGYFLGGPRGTALEFPTEPPKHMLQMGDHSSQQGGTAMSMAVWVYYEEAGPPTLLGMPLITKVGSYRWMVNPGKPWHHNHVHLGLGAGYVVPAMPHPDPSFTIPVKKWLCLAVTIGIDITAGQSTLHFYLNGELLSPKTVYPSAFPPSFMNGNANLYINANTHYWAGKIDSFTLWQSLLSPMEINEYCNCHSYM